MASPLSRAPRVTCCTSVLSSTSHPSRCSSQRARGSSLRLGRGKAGARGRWRCTPHLWGTPWGLARARRALKVPAACRIEGRACEVGRGAARKAAVRGAVATQTACAGRARLKAGAQGEHAPEQVDGVGREEADVAPVLDCAADGLTLLAHGHAEAGEAA
eukprot:scaffold131804_cov60-Phaeocystis_antarctica.AAC.2